jgi:hypothetical protein
LIYSLQENDVKEWRANYSKAAENQAQIKTQLADLSSRIQAIPSLDSWNLLTEEAAQIQARIANLQRQFGFLKQKGDILGNSSRDLPVIAQTAVQRYINLQNTALNSKRQEYKITIQNYRNLLAKTLSADLGIEKNENLGQRAINEISSSDKNVPVVQTAISYFTSSLQTVRRLQASFVTDIPKFKNFGAVGIDIDRETDSSKIQESIQIVKQMTQELKSKGDTLKKNADQFGKRVVYMDSVKTTIYFLGTTKLENVSQILSKNDKLLVPQYITEYRQQLALFNKLAVSRECIALLFSLRSKYVFELFKGSEFTRK